MNIFFGGNGEEATPVPISNTEVKLFSADGTAREAEWESRSLPKIFINPEPFWFRVFYFWTAKLRYFSFSSNINFLSTIIRRKEIILSSDNSEKCSNIFFIDR